MSDDRPSDVLGALPRRRPHRRSAKRAAPAPAEPAATERKTKPAATERKAKPAASRSKPGARASAARTRGARSATKARSAGSAASNRSEATPAAATGHQPTPPTALPRPTRGRAEPLRQPAQPAGVPATPRARAPEHPRRVGGTHMLGTAAQAAAELAEIGLSVSARALRNAIRRLPRP